MNTKQYDYILSVAELKNFGLAAEKCNITQSTLSTMIGRFEDEISIKIFDRKTKPVTLTKEGEEIVLRLKFIKNEILNLKESVSNLKGELNANLTIGIIPTVAPYLLPEFLNDFAQKHNDINFRVSEMITTSILKLLEKRELDIGIVALPLNNENLIEIPLYEESFLLYDCTENRKKEVESLETLDYSKFWLLNEGHCLHTEVSTICEISKNKNSDVNFNFRASSIESLIKFVKIHNGITLLPYLAGLEFTTDERKKLSKFKSPVPNRTIGLVVHRHFVKAKILQALKKDIQNKINPLLNITL